MTINEALEQVGLNKRESLVYLHLLKYGASYPTEIAAKTNIKRPNVYEYVKTLEEKGLIYYQLANKRKLIVAERPEKVSEMINQKLNLAKTLIPALKALDSEGSFQGKISFYQGKRSMINLFNEALEMKGKELWGFWSAKDMDKILNKKTVEKFIAKRLKKGIKLKTLHPIEKESFYSDEMNTDKGRRLTQIAYIPENYTFSLSIQIYDDTIAFYSSKKESYGFKVESKEFAEVMRTLYDIAWNNSGKLNQQSPL